MNIRDIIGKTPLLKLEHLLEPGSAEVYVKYEGTNPTGSMKDRMALSMIEGAERSGRLSPGGTVVEYTGGSTGTSLAMICAVKGYKSLFVTSDAFASEKLRMMKAFGAELDIVHSPDGKITAGLIDALVHRAGELSRVPGFFWTDQFNNTDNRSAYHAMADEIINALDGRIDEFIMGVGTGGCFSGNAEILTERIPGIKCIALEPENVRSLSGGDTSGTHRLEGIGAGFVPHICRLDLADEIMQVSDEDAGNTARKLALAEGIFGGTTSGANVWAAMVRARKAGPGKRIVTIIVDSGLKYLDGELYR